MRGVFVMIVIAGCGATPSEEREAVGAEPTVLRIGEIPAEEPSRGAGGMEPGPPEACMEQAQAAGAELGATATITGLAPRGERAEELARVPCNASEDDEACLRRAEQSERAERGMAADLRVTLEGDRRVHAVLVLDGTRLERTFDGAEALATYVALQRDGGKQVVVESTVAEIEAGSRVAVVSQVRPLAPNERRGRARLMIPPSAGDRVREVAGRHDLEVVEIAPAGDATAVTVECR